MTKHWIRTSYVPERYSETITPNKWYEVEDFSYFDDDANGVFVTDEGYSEGVYVNESTWLDGDSWDYCESDTCPDTNTSVIVPIKDLQAVEEARVKLLEFLSEQYQDCVTVERLAQITSAFYKVGNFKYPEV